MKDLTQKAKKQRKLLAFIPILALPFICMLFWALGGGLDANAKADSKDKAGLNTQLPDPNFDGSGNENKLSFYQQATQDSLKLQEQMRNDPYYQSPLETDSMPESAGNGQSPYSFSSHGTGYGDYAPSGDPNVDKINQRLSRLYGQLEQPGQPQQPVGSPTNELDQMQAMLQAMGQTGSQDPEMAQLDGMLEKILDIQNPQRAKEKLRERSLKNRKQVYPVSARQKDNPVSLLQGNEVEQAVIASRRKTFSSISYARQGNEFYDWSENRDGDMPDANSVTAVVQQTATVVSGATVKLRLTDDIYINGTHIKAGTFVYGTCALNADRLVITLSSIRYRNSLFPVNLTAYDMDGIAGIYMPGAISRDVAKNAAQDAVQGVDYYTLDNSLSAQATSVGIQAAKSLLSKKAKLVKVTVKAGYKVLLKDANSQE